MNNLAERDDVLVGPRWIVHCDRLNGTDRVYYGDGSWFATRCAHDPKWPAPPEELTA